MPACLSACHCRFTISTGTVLTLRPAASGKKLVLATKPRCRKLCRAEKLTAAAVAATSPAAAAVGAATADAPAPAATGAAPAVAPAAGSTAAPSAAPSAGATADAAATEAGPSTGTGAKRGGATGDGEAAAEFPGADPKLFEPYDGRPPHQRGEGGEVLEKAAAGMVVGRCAVGPGLHAGAVANRAHLTPPQCILYRFSKHPCNPPPRLRGFPIPLHGRDM